VGQCKDLAGYECDLEIDTKSADVSHVACVSGADSVCGGLLR